MASSYNQLFGLGIHSEDANVEGWWLLQDDAASTVVDDQSSNSRDGTNSFGNTSTESVTGPNNWIVKAFEYNGGEYCLLPSALDSISGPKTILGRGFVYTGSTGLMYIVGSSFSDRNYLGWDSGNSYFRWGSGAAFGSSSIGTDTWYSSAMTLSAASSATAKGYINGSLVGTVSGQASSSSPSLNIGSYLDGSGNHWVGKLCDVSVWSRELSSDEIGQWHHGPEPINTVAGTIDEDGNFDVGTWALPSPFASGSNGTITYEVVAVNAAGSVLDSATTSTGTLDISSESGNTVYLLVRASNTGGYDVGDYATRTSSYGSASDGYYEIASVTAAGGGTIPSGSGTISAIASLSGVGKTVHSGSGTISAIASLSGVGKTVHSGSGQVAAISSIIGVGEAVHSGSGSIESIATLSGTGLAVRYGSGSVESKGVLTGVGSAPVVGEKSGYGTITAIGTLSGVGYAPVVGGASGYGSVTAIASVTGVGKAIHSGSGSVGSIAAIIGTGERTSSGYGQIEATVTLVGVGQNGETPTGSLILQYYYALCS